MKKKGKLILLLLIVAALAAGGTFYAKDRKAKAEQAAAEALQNLLRTEEARLKEETGLDVKLDSLFYVYSDPARDARQHTMTTVFVAHADGEPAGSDDAEIAQYFPFDNLPSPIAFDHATIIADYLEFRKTGRQPELARALKRMGL